MKIGRTFSSVISFGRISDNGRVLATDNLLIVDAGLMRTAARENHGERTLAETVAFDRAVAAARSYMGENSTLLVAGNFGIGGLSPPFLSTPG